MDTSLFDKEKIEWLHTLLKSDAPQIYQRYLALKARKETIVVQPIQPIAKPVESGGDDFIEGLEKDKLIWKEIV